MGILSFSGRAGRLEYFLVNIGIYLLSVVSQLAFISTDPITGEASVSPVIIMLLLPTIYFGYGNAVRRLHDLGHTGWVVLLSLVPLINLALGLYLLFTAGNEFGNKFGPPPGRSPEITPEAQRARAESIARQAEEQMSAQRSSSSHSYVNDDGTFNADDIYTFQDR